MSDWTLRNLEIEKTSCFTPEPMKGNSHWGKVMFENSHRESFTVNLPPELVETMLVLLRGAILQTAEGLVAKLTTTLPSAEAAALRAGEGDGA